MVAGALSGRDRDRLLAVAQQHAGAEVRVAGVGDPASLDLALSGSAVVINCAGPFIDTALPLIDAAIRCDAHYLDVSAEQSAVLSVFERFGKDSRIGTVIVPAMAFFGGLGDLLATQAMADWESAGEISLAVALDSWRPTQGTRVTGQRNPGPRLVFTNGQLVPVEPTVRRWAFPAPFGEQDVVDFPLAETIIISRHLRAANIHVFMNRAPLADIRDPNTPPPVAADEHGRSSQVFVMEVSVRRGLEERRAMARGRDIYATSAAIVAEAAQRALSGAVRKTGVVTAGEAFDARDFLESLGMQ